MQGLVVDAFSRPVVGADVTLQGTPFRAVTDATGHFVLANLPAGPQQLQVDGRLAVGGPFPVALRAITVPDEGTQTLEAVVLKPGAGGATRTQHSVRGRANGDGGDNAGRAPGRRCGAGWRDAGAGCPGDVYGHGGSGHAGAGPAGADRCPGPRGGDPDVGHPGRGTAGHGHGAGPGARHLHGDGRLLIGPRPGCCRSPGITKEVSQAQRCPSR